MPEISISFYNNSSVRQECLSSRSKRRHKTGCRYLPTYDVGGVASELREKDGGGGGVGKRERRESHRRRERRQGCKGYDRSTSDSKEAPVLRATPQCSNSIDYCCWCIFLPALTYDKRAPIPGARLPSRLPGRIDEPRRISSRECLLARLVLIVLNCRIILYSLVLIKMCTDKFIQKKN